MMQITEVTRHGKFVHSPISKNKFCFSLSAKRRRLFFVSEVFVGGYVKIYILHARTNRAPAVHIGREKLDLPKIDCLYHRAHHRWSCWLVWAPIQQGLIKIVANANRRKMESKAVSLNREILAHFGS